MKIFLDEVTYFLARAQNWAEPPIMYAVVQESFQQVESLFRVLT